MQRRTSSRWAREVLIIVTLTLVVVGLVITAPACSKQAATGDFSVNSSTNANHNHAVTVLGKDVDSPPAQANYTSTVAGGHSHQITLTKANLDAIRNGESVTVTSTVVNGHSHTWTIKKP